MILDDDITSIALGSHDRSTHCFPIIPRKKIEYIEGMFAYAVEKKLI